MANTVSPEYIKIVKLFNTLSGSKAMWQIFSDCMEIYSLSISNSVDVGEEFKKREKRYRDITKTYSKGKMEIIVKIFAEIALMIEEHPFRDTLGSLYMQLEMGNKAHGQFFTPYSVSYAMAKLALDKDTVNSSISDKGFITINEPAVGGGANVIAACEILDQYGVDYRTKAVFVCQDLARLTAMMCHIVLSLMGCSAIIKIGNTLSNPYTNYVQEKQNGSELLISPMFVLNNCYGKV